MTPPGTRHATSTVRHALLAGTGMVLARISGLVRQRVLAQELGISDAADVFNAAFRVPNLLQTLFSDGALSASFVPVYARLRAEGRFDEARRVADALFGLLALVVSVLVLLGVMAPAWILGLTVPGFDEAKRSDTVHLVRLLFPGAGLLALSGLCLGVLAAHRRFLLAQAAPILWNAAIVVALLAFGRGLAPSGLAELAALGSVVGSALQLLGQLPAVRQALGGLRPRVDLASPSVRLVLIAFIPVLLGRCVAQANLYAEQVIGSMLPAGAVAGLATARNLALLPLGLFAGAVVAAELPEMSSTLGSERDVATALRERLSAGLARVAFLAIPSAMALVALGDVLTAGLFQSGRFTARDTQYVWGIVAGSSVGLTSRTLARLYTTTLFALRDTRTPATFAVVRLVLASVLGYLSAVLLPEPLGIEARWGAVGLTASAGLAGHVELMLLERRLERKIGRTGLDPRRARVLWAAASVGAAAAWGVKLALPALAPLPRLLLVVTVYGVAYLGMTRALGVPESIALWRRLQGLGRRAPPAG